MDIFMPIALFAIFFIFFTICGWCCKRKREGIVYGYGPTVTVSTQHVQASPVVVPPYPVDPRHQPQQTAPAPGFTTHNSPYPTSMPYPQTAVPAYYPRQPMGGIMPTPYPPTTANDTTPYPTPSAQNVPYPPTSSHNAPYPTTGPYPPSSSAGDYNRPPPYDIAVSTPPVQPLPTKEAYGKQSPYNPGYSS